MQKEQNVIRLFFILACLLNISKSFAQQKIQGKYFVPIIFAYEYYVFDQDGTFYFEEGADLGTSSLGKGHYQIKNDSLILNYDLTELKISTYHKHRYYANNKDSINVRIRLLSLDKSPISGNTVSIYSEGRTKYSDKNGFVEFNLKKEKKQLEFNVASLGLGFGYDFSIWKNRNYEIEVFLSLDNYGTPYKNQIIKYKIMRLKDDFIKLKTDRGGVMKLVRSVMK